MCPLLLPPPNLPTYSTSKQQNTKHEINTQTTNKMVYRRRRGRSRRTKRTFRRSRRTFRRRSYRRKGRGYIPRPELKWRRVAVTSAVDIDSQGVMLDLLSGLTQGTGAHQRIGAKIRLKGISLQFLLSTAHNVLSALDDEYNVVRLMAFDGDVGAFSNPPGVGTIPTVNDPYNAGVYPHFKHIYKNHIFKVQAKIAGLNSGDYTVLAPGLKWYKTYIPIHRTQEYMQDSASYTKNQFYLSFISDSGLMPHPKLTNFIYTVYYYDN